MATQRAPWDLLREKDAEMAKMHDQLDRMAFSDARLSKKVKLLMAMAIDASHGKEGGVRVYASRAREAGATDDEIFEAVRVATLICGTGGQTTALKGLDELIGGTPDLAKK